MSSTILIVDDDASARETILAILDGYDYHLELALNGSEALLKAQQITPDLVLLDVMMPGMDGFEVCQRMRENQTLREVPILLLTALDDRDSRLAGLRAGADDFLSKPIDAQELRTRVATITRLNRYRTLLQQRENLQAMAERVIQAQEAERLRISREIHDDIGQSLTIHHLQLQFIRDRLPEGHDELHQLVQELIAESSKTFSKLRLLAQDLRPPLLDTLGLVLALKAFCSDFSRRTGIPTLFEANKDAVEIPDTLSITLYRVLQETLSNIAKHAGASQAWVTLDMEEEELSLTVQDNGKGIPAQSSPSTGLGLQGMKERVTLAGGIFFLNSKVGQGTIVAVRFPIKSHSSLLKAEVL